MSKLTKKAEAALKKGSLFARESGYEYVGTEHLLLGLAAEKNVAGELLMAAGVKVEELKELLEEFNTGTADLKTAPADIEYSPRLKEVIDEAESLSALANTPQIGTDILLLAIIRNNTCMAYKLLQTIGVDFRNLYNQILGVIGNSDFSQELSKASQKGRGKSMVDRYTRDLTKSAREGRLDPVIGRDKEITRLLQILSRKTKNNPCLIGEPGVGKTAIVEALASRIADGAVPDILKEKKLLVADITAMVAGSKYRGEFEERIKGLIDEVSADGKYLLFIDEVHTLIGAGSAEGSMDAANILKPALARGELQIIGATTISEYRKNIEKDAALERRFQPVMVEEPDEKECETILKGIRPAYEKHHGVVIGDDAVLAAVKLSARYITDRCLPDKAIDLLDEACAKVKLGLSEEKQNVNASVELALLEKEKESCVLSGDLKKASEISAKQQELKKKAEKSISARKKKKELLTVGAEDIAMVVASWTKIPVKTLTQAETDKLKNLEATLHERVVGQDEAVLAVSRAVRRGRVGLKNPNRPVGSFLFLGPTGVGKTEISKALAAAVFDNEKSIIRVDMSEYMEKASVSKMIGSAPGYVGYEEGGQLSEQVRRNPYSVVLFDEIEKAHPDVFNILLQILDEGNVTDSQGRHVNFKNTIIIMTSNCGASSLASGKRLGFGSLDESKDKYQDMKTKVMEEVKRTFRPELLNRIDDIIVFHSLTEDQLKNITALMLSELKKRVREQLSIEVEFSQEVIEFLAKKGYDVKYGARPVRRAIQTYAEDLLTDTYLEGKIKAGDRVRIYMNEDKPEIETC